MFGLTNGESAFLIIAISVVLIIMLAMVTSIDKAAKMQERLDEECELSNTTVLDRGSNKYRQLYECPEGFVDE